jgi:hypothetical protein
MTWRTARRQIVGKSTPNVTAIIAGISPDAIERLQAPVAADGGFQLESGLRFNNSPRRRSAKTGTGCCDHRSVQAPDSTKGGFLITVAAIRSAEGSGLELCSSVAKRPYGGYR